MHAAGVRSPGPPSSPKVRGPVDGQDISQWPAPSSPPPPQVRWLQTAITGPHLGAGGWWSAQSVNQACGHPQIFRAQALTAHPWGGHCAGPGREAEGLREERGVRATGGGRDRRMEKACSLHAAGPCAARGPRPSTEAPAGTSPSAPGPAHLCCAALGLRSPGQRSPSQIFRGGSQDEPDPHMTQTPACRDSEL